MFAAIYRTERSLLAIYSVWKAACNVKGDKDKLLIIFAEYYALLAEHLYVIWANNADRRADVADHGHMVTQANTCIGRT